MERNDLLRIQDSIGGYQFKNLDLLQQAFVRRSYSEENGGEDNEVLEFIGDKVLDYIVVQLLSEKHGSYVNDDGCEEFASELDEGELTEAKRKLVEKSTLAERIDALDLSQYLIMGNGDIKENADTKASVKEDLFEAILGAVALDCKWDNRVLLDTVEAMLEPEIILEENNDENYRGLIQEWTEVRYGDIPWFHYDKFDTTYSYNSLPEKGVMVDKGSVFDSNDYKRNVLCGVKLGDYEYSFWARGFSKADARKNVCLGAYEYLEKHDLLLSIRDEIENPCEEAAISQLETLSRRGYFKLPEYTFKQKYGKNGNPIWNCTCSIPDKEITGKATSSIKKNAKKEAAYQALYDVLNKHK